MVYATLRLTYGAPPLTWGIMWCTQCCASPTTSHPHCRGVCVMIPVYRLTLRAIPTDVGCFGFLFVFTGLSPPGDTRFCGVRRSFRVCCAPFSLVSFYYFSSILSSRFCKGKYEEKRPPVLASSLFVEIIFFQSFH